MTITNSKQAKDIIKHSGNCKCIGPSTEELNYAEGFLDALKHSEEVKDLVKSLENLKQYLNPSGIPSAYSVQSGPAYVVILTALSKYKEAVGETEK